MSNDWLDIAVLEDYLDGKLDAKTMNKVEREALDDPFVAEALAGLSASPKRSLQSISLLQKQLHERIEQQHVNKKQAVITWQRLSMGSAAAVLFITAGIVFWMKQTNYQQAVRGKQVEVALAPKAVAPDQPVIQPENTVVASKQLAKSSDVLIASAQPSIKLRKKVSTVISIDTSSLISGKIVDAATGLPMAGAYVSATNSNTGLLKVVATSDKEGKFSLKKDSTITGKDLVVSYVSYENKVLQLNGANSLSIALNETKNQLADEVVIRGYVKRTKEGSAGASTVVSGKEVKDVPVGNVEQLLQGKVAGLNIQNKRGTPTKVGDANELAEVSVSDATPVEGWDHFLMYLSNNNKFKSEPRLGKPVALTFEVDAAGNPVRLKVVKGISSKYDNEAKRLITSGPKWKSLQTDSVKKVILKVDF